MDSTTSADEDSISISVCLGKRRNISDEKPDDPIKTKRSRLFVSLDQISEEADQENDGGSEDRINDDRVENQLNDDEGENQTINDGGKNQTNGDGRRNQANDDGGEEQETENEKEFLIKVKELSGKTHRPMTDVIRTLGVTSCNFEAAYEHILGSVSGKDSLGPLLTFFY